LRYFLITEFATDLDSDCLAALKARKDIVIDGKSGELQGCDKSKNPGKIICPKCNFPVGSLRQQILVGLRGNSGALLEEVAGAFAATNAEDIARDWSQGKNHGRLETRVAEIIAFEKRTKYPHLGMAVRVTRTRGTVRKGDVVGKSTEVS